MGNDHRCRWVRHRLPLLAGGELGVDDRRKVERHLIGCGDCRGRRVGSEGALAALRAVAEDSPARADAPSLWPALARQIRESRHRPARPSWRDLLALGLESSPWRPALVAAAFGLAALAVVATLPRRSSPSKAPAVVASGLDSTAKPRETPSKAKPTPGARLRPPGLLTQGEKDPFAAPAVYRPGADLERGTPMNPGKGDPQRSY